MSECVKHTWSTDSTDYCSKCGRTATTLVCDLQQEVIDLRAKLEAAEEELRATKTLLAATNLTKNMLNKKLIDTQKDLEQWELSCHNLGGDIDNQQTVNGELVEAAQWLLTMLDDCHECDGLPDCQICNAAVKLQGLLAKYREAKP